MTTQAKRFAPLPADRAPAESESQVAEFWRAERIFERSLEQTRGGQPFVFFEGPPTANGMPHHGHVLTRVIKDLFPRYKTMLGFHVERKAGWDTHGLPVEIEVEKTLGLDGKKDVERYGIEPFVTKCRESVWKYQGEWEKLTRRIGFWLDMKRPYITYSKDYIESVWWSIAQIDKKGLLYKGHKILPWCPHCQTGLSSHEVGQGYEKIDDPAITVAFKKTDEPDTYFLAWTTTPWTLPSNVALVVGAKIDYVFARSAPPKPKKGEAAAPADPRTFILAEARLETVLGKGAEVLKKVKGADLVGARYEPLFDFAGKLEKAWVVLSDPFVSTGDGTGIVHAAPAFGEDDHRVCKAAGLDFVNLVQPDGRFVKEMGAFAGRFVKEADLDLARDLKRRGLLIKQEQINHDYPHCWRCKSPLLYFAREAWYIATTKVKDRLVAINKTIEWFPETIRDGRFGDFLDNNKDWALSRERYWGTPLPVWEATQDDGTVTRFVAESVDALRKLNPSIPADLDPHRPWIDDVTIPCPKTGKPMRRVKEVIDCWYDSGAMPYAQWGYPHAPGSQELFAKNAQANYICEAIDQTRGWFYTLHAISTLLFDRSAYQRCLVLGHVNDAHGKKLSKKDKNYQSPDQVIDAHGADAMRWFFYSKMSPGQGVRFFDEAVRDARRTFLLKLLNVYKFFQEYASSDGFDPAPGGTPRPAPAQRDPLDRWILSELHTTTEKVRAALDGYEFNQAAQALEAFVDGLSNWYVRRSRDRGWSTLEECRRDPALLAGKNAFWWTTWEVLSTLSKLLAPFTPFVAEDLHRVLIRERGIPGAKPSVHLERYPDVDPSLQDRALEARMSLARRAVNLGLQVRTEAKLKVRQPLSRAVVLLSSPREEEDMKTLASVVADELNVKQVEVSREHDRYVLFDTRVDFKRLGPRFGKRLGAVRAALGQVPANELAAAARAGRPYVLQVEGGAETLAPEDLDVRLTAREGFAAAQEGGLVVVVDTAITDDLVREGVARDLQSLIQGVRKTENLPFDARVRVWVEGGNGVLGAVLAEHGERLRRETLADEIALGAPPAGRALAATSPASLGDVDGVVVSIERVTS